MKSTFLEILSFLVFILGISCQYVQLYITSQKTCGNNCSTAETDTYDSLIVALSQHNYIDELQLVLLGNADTEHYLLSGEKDDMDSNHFYEFVDAMGFYSLTIRPLFCDEEEASDPRFSGQCIERNQKTTLVLKQIPPRFLILTQLSVQNIIFDWTDSSQSVPENDPCLYQRKRCCKTARFQNGFECSPEPFNYDQREGLFEIYPWDSGWSSSVIFSYIEVRNFRNKGMKSFLRMNCYVSTEALFENCIIDDVTFRHGLVLYDGEYVWYFNLKSFITFRNISYSNYNYWGQNLDENWKEGYLVYLYMNFIGKVTITDSKFNHFAPSSYQCVMSAHMDNKFKVDPDQPRTYIWEKYHKSDSITIRSLITIDYFDGDLTVENSEFRNIIGSKGSVVFVGGTSSVNTQFTFKNNTFDNNFAMHSFANILIATLPASEDIMNCPQLNIENSSFTNSAGCPGAYGNVGYICYCDSNPPSFVPFYYTSYKYFRNLDYEFSRIFVKVVNSTFEGNLLSVSNSLAILSSPNSYLEGNIFRGNGGSTAEIALYSLEKSGFLDIKPQQNLDSMKQLIHFGQSTAVHFDRVVKVHFRKNLFQGNFGPWEGSYVLGTDITIRIFYSLGKEMIKFEGDVFRDHLGIPPEIAEKISNPNLKDNSYTPPLITIGTDLNGEKKIMGSTVIDRNFVALEGVQFINNIASYDIEKGCSYNSDELVRICSWVKGKKRYKSGFIKFMSGEDIIDDERKEDIYKSFSLYYINLKSGVSLNNVKIINNTLLTDGCLFPSHETRSYFLYNLEIEKNTIEPSGSYFIESSEAAQLQNEAFQNMNGIFCLAQKDSYHYAAPSLFFAVNLKVANNFGTIFNIHPDELSALKLENSIFINNTCPYGPAIAKYAESHLASMNNIFIKNKNALGLFMMLASSTLHQSILFHTYLGNSGKQASIAYVEQNTIEEFFTRAYWNSVRPKFDTFRDLKTPQGGLYFLQSAQLSLLLSQFKMNYPYAGCILSVKSKILIEFTNITDHHINGSSIIGNFVQASDLTMKSVQILNNSLYSVELSARDLGFIKVFMSTLTTKNLFVTQMLYSNNGAFLIAVNTELYMENVSISEVYSTQKNSFFRIYSSNLNINNIDCNIIQSLLNAVQTSINIKSVTIKNFKPSSSLLFLVNVVDSILDIQRLKYLGGNDIGNYISLFTGSNNKIKIADSYFLNPVVGVDKLFELVDNIWLFVIKTTFQYTISNPQALLFFLMTNQKAIIQESVFLLSDFILETNSILDSVYFVSNTIVTPPGSESFRLVNNNLTYFVNNQILRQENEKSIQPFPESQIYLQDGYGLATFRGNIFQSLDGSKGIIRAQASTQPYMILSEFDLFINNNGYSGGAFHLDDSLPSSSKVTSLSQLNISNSAFILNKAISYKNIKGKGGAIYQTTSTRSKQITNIKSSYFLNNSAEIIGGAIFFNYFPPTIGQDCKFIDNFATRINHIASYPVKLNYYKGEPKAQRAYEAYILNQRYLQQSNSPDENILQWENIPSGLFTNNTYTFEILDMYGQIVNEDDTSLLELYPVTNSEAAKLFLSSKPYIKAEKGLYVLNNFRFIYMVNESIDIKFKSTAIQNQAQILSDTPIIMNDSATIKVTFRRCERGEYLSRDGNSTTCIRCQAKFWQTSPNPDAAYCAPCQEVSTYCLGGDHVGPKREYWRINETADIVLRCLEPSACLGNDLSKENISLNPTGECAYGYKGNLCSNCISGWANAGSGTCINCLSDVWYYIRVVLTFLLQIALITKGIKGTISFSKDYEQKKQVNLNGAILVRILTNYLQFVSLVSGIPVTWPEVFKRIIQPLQNVSSISENLFTIDCMFPNEEDIHIKRVFIKLILGTFGGFGFILLSGVFLLMYYLLNKRCKEFKNMFLTTSIVICFMLQTSAIQNSFSLFECTNLYREDNPSYFLNKDYDVPCWEGEHLYWSIGLGIPSIVIWSFGLPILAFYFLWRNKHQLEKKEISEKYSFLYGGYISDKYYWEFFIMARKFVFIGLLYSSSLNSPQLEIYISVPIIIIFYVIQHFAKPYADPQLNFLEKLSLISSSAVNFCGLYFELISHTEELEIVFIIIGVSSNILFFVVFLRLYFANQIQKIHQNEKIQKTLDSLNKRLCCINFLKAHLLQKKAPVESIISELSKHRKVKTLLNPKLDRILTSEESPLSLKKKAYEQSITVKQPKQRCVKALLTTENEILNKEKLFSLQPDQKSPKSQFFSFRRNSE